MVQFYTAAEQRAIRRYRRRSWRSGASEQAKRHALRLALSRLPKRGRQTFLDEVREEPSRRSSAPAASLSDPILISDDDDDEDDDAAEASGAEASAAVTGGGSNADKNNDLLDELGHPDADVGDDENLDLIDELEAELMAPESPVLATAALPPLPPPSKEKKKKRRRKKTLAEKLGVEFVDEEKLQAEFESLVAESRMRTGATGAPAALAALEEDSVVAASASRSGIDGVGEARKDEDGRK